MPPSSINDDPGECSIQLEKDFSFEQQIINDNRNKLKRHRASKCPNRFVRDWTWSREWPLTPIIEEYDGKTACTTRKKTSRHTVSFNPQVDSFPFGPVKHITEEEFQERWWTASDYAVIRRMLHITLKMAEIGYNFTFDDTDFCLRGVYRFSEIGSAFHKERRQGAVEGVLKWQEYLWATGHDDNGEHIAKMYAEYCDQDRKLAAFVGQKDAFDSATIFYGSWPVNHIQQND